MTISRKDSRSSGGVYWKRAKVVFAATTLAMAAFIGLKSIPSGIPTNAPIIRDVSANDVDAVRDAVTRKPSELRAVDLDGNTPLHIAAMGGYDQMLRMLIDAGADVNATNRAGFTPLASALLSFEKNQADIVTTLIAAGARKDVELADGRSLGQLASSLPNVTAEVAVLVGAEDPPSRRQGQAVASASGAGTERK